jgi:hypothetical protein
MPRAILAILAALAQLLTAGPVLAAAEAGSFEITLPAGAQAIVLGICVLYFIGVLAFGAFFGRFAKDTNDFFYSGQKFPWWLVTASMIATGIGSYSFLKYAQAGFNHGLGSTMTYLNDWFVMPFFMLDGCRSSTFRGCDPYPNTSSAASIGWFAISRW